MSRFLTNMRRMPHIINNWTIFDIDDGDYNFSRTGDQTFADFEGLIKTVPTDGSAHVGARMVENRNTTPTVFTAWTKSGEGTGSAPIVTPDFLEGATRVQFDQGAGTSSADFSILNAGNVITRFNGDGRITCRIRSLSGTVDLAFRETFAGFEALTITEDWKILSTLQTGFNASGDVQLLLRGTFTTSLTADILIDFCMIEDTTGQANQNPSEFVDGVEYFLTENGNTVDGSGVVTEATGAAITGAKGILLEGARTNLSLHSEDLNAGTITLTEITVGSSTSTFNIPMQKITPSTNNLSHWYGRNTDVTSGAMYTQTFFVEAEGYGFVQITGSTGFATSWVNIDLSDGSTGNSNIGTAKIRVKALAGGVFKINYTDIAIATVSGRILVVVLSSDAVTRLPTFTGDGTSGIAVTGNSLEQADFSSSYIQTAGSTATRSATSLTRSWPFPANGISFQIKVRPQFDYTDSRGTEFPGIVTFHDGTNNNRLELRWDNTNDRIFLNKAIGGTQSQASTLDNTLMFSKGDEVNIRGRVDTTGVYLWVDDIPVRTAFTGIAPDDWVSLLTTIEIGIKADGSSPAFQTVESLRIWNTAKPDAFLENLT